MALVVFGQPSYAQTAPASSAASTKPRLLVVGDSVLEGTYDKIPAALPEWDVTVDAHMNRSTADGPAVFRSHPGSFDVVVVQLGTNDAGTPSIYEPRVQAMMDAVAGVPRVLWLTIHEARPYYAQANDIIRRLAAQHPNVQVVDWNSADKPGDTYDDGLHLTPQGADSMAAVIASAVRGPATPASTTTTTAPSPATAGASKSASADGTDGSAPGVVASAASHRAGGSGGKGPSWGIAVLLVAAVALAAAVPFAIVRRRRETR